MGWEAFSDHNIHGQERKRTQFVILGSALRSTHTPSPTELQRPTSSLVFPDAQFTTACASVFTALGTVWGRGEGELPITWDKPGRSKWRAAGRLGKATVRPQEPPHSAPARLCWGESFLSCCHEPHVCSVTLWPRHCRPGASAEEAVCPLRLGHRRAAPAMASRGPPVPAAARRRGDGRSGE